MMISKAHYYFVEWDGIKLFTNLAVIENKQNLNNFQVIIINIMGAGSLAGDWPCKILAHKIVPGLDDLP